MLEKPDLRQRETKKRLLPAGFQEAKDAKWTSSAKLEGFSATSRQKEVIDMFYRSACCKLSLDPLMPPTEDAIRSLDVYCDVSQHVTSCRWSTGHIQGTTASSNIYSFQLDRLLMPEEMMMIYGWPRRIVEARLRVSEVVMPDLAANTMALQPLAAVMLAVIITACPSNCRLLSPAASTDAKP